MNHRLLWPMLLLAAAACQRAPDAPPAEPASPADNGDAAARLAELYAQYDEEWIVLNPAYATLRGDARYNDRLGDYISPDYLQASRALAERYLDAVTAFDPARLDGQDRLSHEIFVHDRRLELEGYANGSAEAASLLPVSQFQSIPEIVAVFGSGTVQPFATAADYDAWLARSGEFAGWVDQAITNMRRGVERGIVQPRVVIERTLPQLAAHLVEEPQQSVFWRPVAGLPETISAEDRARLETAYRRHISDVLVPAYRRLHDYLRDEYLEHSRTTVGLAALPDGEQWYEYLARVSTTTRLGPREIHDIGVREIERISAEMERVKREVGFDGTLREFFDSLRGDARFYYRDASELLAGYEAIRERVNPRLPEIFATRPEADYVIKEVEAFRAPSAAAAAYFPGTPDGSRPGIFYVNTFQLDQRPKYLMEAISLHEASPGHHFQISLAQEVRELPNFRRYADQGSVTAYVEGWGLYAESLGRELGLYTDPYQWFGRLTLDAWRANRLVVDTGMHYLGWTREQAIQQMRNTTPLSEQDIVAEVERYIAIPGQALAYKVGQLKLLELRERAQTTLGERFDIRGFHDTVLTGGAMPLAVLEQVVERWIAEQR